MGSAAFQFAASAPPQRTETTSSPSSSGQTPISSVLTPGNISLAKLTSIAKETPSSSFSVKTPSSRVFGARFFQIIADGHGLPPVATVM
jgi:hypothetical protein